MKRMLFAGAFGVAALALAAPAAAQFGRPDQGRYSHRDDVAPYYQVRRAAYENGYREGLKEGEKDGRRRDRFAYQDEREFQRGDKGYRREYGDRDRYRQTFRSGYAEGYRDGYRRVDVYRNDRGWRGSGSYPGGPGYGYGSSAAFQNGVNDGYEKGVEDARERRSYDVLRHKWYRSGDRHYNSRYGPRHQYEAQYRDGFKAGYDRGFREGRRW